MFSRADLLPRHLDVVTELLRALTEGDAARCTELFTPDAVVLRGEFRGGRVRPDATVAKGEQQIRVWVQDIIDHGVRVTVDEAREEDDVLVVRTRWSLSSFHGERVSGTSLARYRFRDSRISYVFAVRTDPGAAGSSTDAR